MPADALAGAGYDILTKSPDMGVDMFAKHDRSLFVFLQGHPEYDPTTLLREYRRDVGRFLRREREGYPALPRHYLDAPSERSLEAFRRRALSARNPELLEGFPAAAIVERFASPGTPRPCGSTATGWPASPRAANAPSTRPPPSATA